MVKSNNEFTPSVVLGNGPLVVDKVKKEKREAKNLLFENEDINKVPQKKTAK
jgi:hypothetical protein